MGPVLALHGSVARNDEIFRLRHPHLLHGSGNGRSQFLASVSSDHFG
jgi:hypothetical protein